MKVAVIGAGVSGLGAAYALKDSHDLVLYEKDSRLGGHANTARIDYDGHAIDVDTGFIVYNARNYPNLVGGRLNDLTLSGYLRLRGFSTAFETNYLLPMGAAIWSTSEHGIGDVPAESFVRFFSNHNLLQMVQPTWRTIKGGSRQYVDKLQVELGGRVRGGAARVRRLARGGVEVIGTDGEADHFDQVILAIPMWRSGRSWAPSAIRPTAPFCIATQA